MSSDRPSARAVTEPFTPGDVQAVRYFANKYKRMACDARTMGRGYYAKAQSLDRSAADCERLARKIEAHMEAQRCQSA